MPIYTVFNDIDFDNFEDQIDDIIKYFEELRKRGVMEYDSDGVVVSINDNSLFYVSQNS